MDHTTAIARKGTCRKRKDGRILTLVLKVKWVSSTPPWPCLGCHILSSRAWLSLYLCTSLLQEGRGKHAVLRRDNLPQRLRLLTLFLGRFQPFASRIPQLLFDSHIFMAVTWQYSQYWHRSACHFKPPLSDWQGGCDSSWRLSSSVSYISVMGHLHKVF